jgi:hypothetical protein
MKNVNEAVQIDETNHVKTTENEEISSNKSSHEPQVGEFKITVRKLEMPVRPRGVLAE